MSGASLSAVYDLNKHHNCLVNKTIQPLKTQFNLPYFSYQRVSLDGSYSLLASRIDFFEYYLSKKFYENDPFLVHPLCYDEGKKIFIINDRYQLFDEKTRIIIEEMETKFNFSESLLILIKSFDFYEIFVFTAPAATKEGVHLYLNNFDLIEKFIKYFKKTTESQINEVQNIGLNISVIKNIDFNRNENQLIDKPENPNQEVLSYSTYEEKNFLKTVKTLTAREYECLYWMTQGKTADETGSILKISRRTVEAHRENCRSKFGIHYTFTNLLYLIGKYQLFT